MGYIIKNTSGILNTRITDVGRRAISKGQFNIAYFQVGDSEIDYLGPLRAVLALLAARSRKT